VFTDIQGLTPGHTDYVRVNAEAEVKDPNSTYHYWATVLKLRKKYLDVLCPVTHHQGFLVTILASVRKNLLVRFVQKCKITVCEHRLRAGQCRSGSQGSQLDIPLLGYCAEIAQEGPVTHHQGFLVTILASVRKNLLVRFVQKCKITVNQLDIPLLGYCAEIAQEVPRCLCLR
jgi:hypothetical protein